MLLFVNRYYHDSVSGAVIRFFRKNDENWIAWKEAGWEKLGTWSLTHRQEKIILEFKYNYAREESYVLTVLSSQAGEVTAFRLENVMNRSWEFY